MKTRHNFNRNIRLDAICSQDGFRVQMEFISFQNGKAIATNGHCLVVAKISEISTFTEEEIEKLNGKFIHRESFKRLIKEDFVQITDDGFLCISDNRKQLIYFSEVDKFPNWKPLFVEKRCSLSKFGIDPKKLLDLQSCLPYKKVKIEFGINEQSAIFISDIRGECDSKGLIMPCSLTNKY